VPGKAEGLPIFGQSLALCRWDQLWGSGRLHKQ
jgi:hypothetical protein